MKKEFEAGLPITILNHFFFHPPPVSDLQINW